MLLLSAQILVVSQVSMHLQGHYHHCCLITYQPIRVYISSLSFHVCRHRWEEIEQRSERMRSWHEI